MRWSDEWRTEGNCFGSIRLNELFYSDLKTTGWWQAKAMCHICRSINECREYAVSSGQPDGIWGGMDPKERERYKRMKPERQAKFVKEVALHVATYANNNP